MNGDAKRNIRHLSPDEIRSFLISAGEPSFRASQVYDWLWLKNARSFAAMTTLPVALREKLEKQFTFPSIAPEHETRAADGTVKTVFRLSDGKFVEGVLIPSGRRTTACVSSQAGCPLGCRFCATGLMGFTRNLDFTEIYDQVTEINRLSLEKLSVPLSNIVYMGMGEPLLNWEEVLRSIARITSKEAMAMSPQRITVSSVGIPDGIRTMADGRPGFHFALSLHAATNAKREKLIPLNKKHPLEALTEAVRYYHRVTGKRITIEYILFGDFNDSPEDAAALARFCKSFPVKINLISYNEVAGAAFRKPDPEKVAAFARFLESKNLVVNLRKSKGEEIRAACGQLALARSGLTES